MTDIKSIASALAAAQMDMGKALKQSNNPHFRSKYADLGSVMDACLEPLNKHGIAVIQPTGEDEHGRHVKTILIHGESGGTLECTVPLIAQKNDMQGYGSAVTYARRYGLMTMAGIAPEDDDGNAASKAAPKRQEGQTQGATPVEVQTAIEVINAAETVADLGTYWTGLNKNAKHVAGDARVIDAKDAKKAELEASPRISETLDGDKIPY
jgi:hypothetical protein